MLPQILNYPSLHNETHPKHKNVRKLEGAWERMIEAFCKNQWDTAAAEENAKEISMLK